ncbi:hypothetical protein MPER_07929 [Moniliophthora perniciosa FA553]|nr:hypothetical protein MPER_07929 [Moniliophthora perniciosa FA553]
MYRHTQDQEYLVEAIGLERACLSSTPQDHPLLAWRLSNLGQSLGLQYEVNDDSSDLDNMAEESIDFQKRAIEHDANAATMTAWWKYRLSETLLLKYMRKGDKGCLKEALGYATDAAHAYSTGHPEYTLVQMTRALILAEMGAEVGVVLGTFRLGLQRSSTVPHMIMECALALAKFAVSKQMYKDALEGYCMALDLMPEVLWFGLEMNDRTVRMSKFNLASIAADAAACSLSIGNPELAIELLEQGRSLLWSQAFSLDTDVSVLDRENPAMALKFRKLSTQLRQAWSLKSEAESHGYRGGDHGHRLFSEWHRIVDEIRSLPGFDRFLQPLPFSVLRESSSGRSGHHP